LSSPKAESCIFAEIYELRDGSGIGVGAPQFGQRRGLYGGLTLAF
jgi:hypothetical protein